MDQFESHPQKSSLVMAGVRPAPILKRCNDMHSDITVYCEVCSNEDQDQTGNHVLIAPCHDLLGVLPPNRKWAMHVLRWTAQNESKDTPIKFKFRIYATKEKRIMEPCWNSPLSYMRGKIASRKKYCYNYYISTWYDLKKAKCSKINVFCLLIVVWVCLYFVTGDDSHFCASNQNWYTLI